MGRLAETGGHDARAEAELDALGRRYEDLVRVSQAIAHDTALSRGKSMTAALTGQLEEARRRISALEAQVAAPSPAFPARAYRGMKRRVRARLDPRHGS
jgi:hypothetical protein